MGKKSTDPAVEKIVISPPRMTTMIARIVGTAPYVQHAFKGRPLEEMKRNMMDGSTAKKGRKKESKDFDASFHDALHVSADGWPGIPASSIRTAMIDACRMTGHKMTFAKMSVFANADGYCFESGTPIIKFTKGEPHPFTATVRLPNGKFDLACRPMWDAGWEAVVRVSFDEDQFSQSDVYNLLARAGWQVGIGAGRPFSRASAGCGWGTFEIRNPEDDA